MMYTRLRALNKIVSVIVCFVFIFGQNMALIAAVDSTSTNQVQVTDAELKQGNNLATAVSVRGLEKHVFLARQL